MKIKIIIFLLSICFASYGDNLKYITLPKDSQKFWQKENVSETTRKAWMKYEELLTRFTKVCSVIESEYDATGKSDLYGKHILELRKISSSPHWKNIATTQPFKVKEGVKYLSSMINKYDAIRSEVLNKRENQVANNRQVAVNKITPVKKGITVIVPEADMIMFPEMTDRRRVYISSLSDSAKIQETGLNMMRSQDPAERANGKKLWRMGLRSGEFSRRANQHIKDEARQAGEDWAQ